MGATYGTYCRLHLHVSAPDIEVIKAGWHKLSLYGKSRERRTWRRDFYKGLLKYHHESYNLYDTVMRGGI